MDLEQRILDAISAYKNNEYTSIRKCAASYSIAESTLRLRLSGGVSRSTAHEHEQYLLTAEEQTLIKWISKLSKYGCPVSPKFTRELAFEIRRSRVPLSTPNPSSTTSISRPGKRWIDRLYTRYPEIKGAWSRQLESSRYNGTRYSIVESYFSSLTELFISNTYAPEDIYNVDESGFAIGASQTSRVLINIRDTASWKRIPGRQQWITAIECIRASGEALPPLLIFKAKYTNTGWIPPNTPLNWRFSTSNSGWTSDSHAYEWVSTIFDPETRREDGRRRLLLLDGHGSHLTSQFIAYCLNSAIDIVVLPPHSSHILQPLDVAVFGPLKRALADETDSLSRLDPGRISRVEWTSSYIRARERALTTSNILSGFRATGISPLSPITILSTLEMPEAPRTPGPLIDGQSTATCLLDRSLLASSPPDGTELRQANSVLNSIVQESSTLESPVKRYIARATAALEKSNSELALLRRENSEQKELLETRKKRTKGKRVALQGKFVFNTEEILQVVRKAEAEAAKKKTRKRKRNASPTPEIEEDVEEVLESEDSESEGSCIAVATRR